MELLILSAPILSVPLGCWAFGTMARDAVSRRAWSRLALIGIFIGTGLLWTLIGSHEFFLLEQKPLLLWTCVTLIVIYSFSLGILAAWSAKSFAVGGWIGSAAIVFGGIAVIAFPVLLTIIFLRLATF